MRQIYIVRHAKSSWNDSQISDFERPLLKKGVKRSKAIGKYLKENSIRPDLIKTSTAKRAIDTVRILNKYLELSEDELCYCNKMYQSSVSECISEICNTDNKYDKLMIVGHNPTITDLANKLIGFTHIDWIVTTGLVIINFEIDNWQEIPNITGQLVEYTTPKELLNKGT